MEQLLRFVPAQARRIVLIGAAGGMAAGMMMALVEMLYGALNSTRSFWDSPMAIWSWVFGQEHFTQNVPGEHVWPVVLGIGAHMANSMMAGVMFAAMATGLIGLLRRRNLDRLALDAAPIMLGVAWGLGLWAIMRYGILPLNAGEDDLFTTAIVTPQWVWWVAHAVLGMTAGLVFDFARRLAPAPAQTTTLREATRRAV